MRTIRAIVSGGNLKPLEPLNLPENTRLTVTLVDDDDVASDALEKLARVGGAFDFLDDPREDLYDPSDGSAV